LWGNYNPAPLGIILGIVEEDQKNTSLNALPVYELPSTDFIPLVQACVKWGTSIKSSNFCYGVAALLFGGAWGQKRILFRCDNMVVVFAINKGRSHSPAMMQLMWRLVIVAATCNFAFAAQHVQGVHGSGKPKSIPIIRLSGFLNPLSHKSMQPSSPITRNGDTPLFPNFICIQSICIQIYIQFNKFPYYFKFSCCVALAKIVSA
jgi:hypothetical protein